MENADCENRVVFTLVLSAAELTDDIANAIYGLGIDDALVGQADGRVFVDLDIEEASYADAIVNCIDKIESVLPDIKVIEVRPPGADSIELVNAYLKARGSKEHTFWGKTFSRIK
jgi:hypothetical protein